MKRIAVLLMLVVLSLASTSCGRRSRITQNIRDLGVSDGAAVDLATPQDMAIIDSGPTATIHMESAPALAIPDNGGGTVSDSISIRSLCSVAAIRVSVDITHPYIGDLTVVLQGSTCAPVTLHNQSGSSADDIVGTYPTTLTVDGPGALTDCVGDAAAGTWTLSLTDSSGGDVGTLNSWALDIDTDCGV